MITEEQRERILDAIRFCNDGGQPEIGSAVRGLLYQYEDEAIAKPTLDADTLAEWIRPLPQFDGESETSRLRFANGLIKHFAVQSG